MTHVYLGFDVNEHELVSEAPTNTDAAGKCLGVFAARLRESLAIADSLGWHIVKALEKAANTPSSSRATALTHALYLTNGRERPKANPIKVGLEVEYKVSTSTSKTAAIEATANEFDLSVRQTGRHYEMLKRVRAETEN